MKYVLIFCIGVIMVWLWVSIYRSENNHRPNYVLHEVEKVAVPDFYRKIIGYDSLEMIYSLNKWNVNFCYPNKWEFEKFKKADSIVFHYDSIMVIHYNKSEVK